MNTFLGAAQQLSPEVIDLDAVRSAGILYLEGYLWDPEVPRAAMEAAISAAREARRKIAFTLSDTFCVDRHRDGFHRLLDEKKVDILFANEAELAAMTGEKDFEAGLASLSAKVPVLVVTRSERGAVAVAGGERASVPAEPIDRLVDTTGAGDLFAAGFLAGQARGLDLEKSLRLGAIAAAEVIQHYGARPEQDLRVLAAAVLG
jgi:sugar/nucleoside kinase (ribokinase family)